MSSRGDILVMELYVLSKTRILTNVGTACKSYYKIIVQIINI